jgi:BMFP domain-containing protein YqiC
MKNKEIEDRLDLLEQKTRSKLAYLLARIQKLEEKILDILAE